MIRALAALLAAVLTLVAAVPAVADDGYVDLRLTVSLDKGTYLATDVVTMHVVVVNAGTAPATGVMLELEGSPYFETDWGEFRQADPGGTLAPGEQVELSASAPAHEAGDAIGQRVEVLSTEPDREPADNHDAVKALVTPVPCDLAITVYGDADRDGVVDPREPMKGVLVTIAGSGGKIFENRTDGAGVVRFTDIPPGVYSVTAKLRNGWVYDTTQWPTVRAGANTAQVRAFQDTAKNLDATVAFDRARYAPGDPLRIRVTLANPTAADVVGVYANCGHYGTDNDIYGMGWAELDPTGDGPGATIRAGETRTWEFTDRVPPRAWDYGFVVLRCEFAHAGALTGAFAETRAAVPGGRGTLTGTVVHDGHPLRGVAFLLIDDATGGIAARAATDAAGVLRFPEVPADTYELRVLGPWQFKEPSMRALQIMAGTSHGFNPLELVPGPHQQGPEDEPPTGPSTVAVVPAPSPAPQAAPRPANLADTGASVVELSALGLLLVVAGAVLLRRPRRAS